MARADRTDFKVNTDYTITEQNYPRVAVAADQTFVVVWSDKREGGQDIYLQKFGADGYALGTNKKVNDDPDTWTHQSDPALATDITGQYSLVWRDYRDSEYPFDPGIYFQRYDSSVTSLGVNRDLTAAVPDSLKEPADISLSPWGGGVVVWADYRNHNWDIYAQRISSVGETLGGNFRVNDDAGTYQQHAPKVSVSPDGWFVVVWYDNRSGNDDIMAQLYDSLGTPKGGNFLAGSVGNTARQAFPDVAADGTGRFTVVWVDWQNGTYPANADIFERRFDTTRTQVGSIRQVNSDLSGRTQREAAIGIDRLGNTAIVWADSTASSWEIMGQMVAVDGSFKSDNFHVNSYTDSAQQHPDVAVDGRKRYVVWADKRNGNYDIYAAIKTYNNPQLIPSVTALKFGLDVSGSVPSAQTIELDHAGYNSLNFRTICSHNWFAVTPASGVTPEQLSVSITTDTLAFGTYLGAITLVDETNHDSSIVISVRLDVTAPRIAFSTDTLKLRAFAGIDEDQTATVTINNSGTGSFNWSATESYAWLALYSLSGQSGELVTVSVNGLSLSAGVQSGAVVFSSAEAYNSPKSLVVQVEAVDNMPYLHLNPDSIYTLVDDPGAYSATVTVENIGVGSTHWTATSSVGWLQISPTSGTDSELFTITLEADTLLNDRYVGYVDVTDSASFSVTERLPFVLDLFVPPPDTISLGSTITALNVPGIVPVELWNGSAINSIDLPLRFDPAAIMVDSFVLSPAYAARFDLNTALDSSGSFTASMFFIGSTDFLLSGHHLLGEIYFTGGSQDIFTTLDTARYDTLRLSVTDTAGQASIPMIIPAEITIGTPTDVADSDNHLLPDQIELYQNYPNPFNSSTIIGVELPEGMAVRLDIFNILGQRVITLLDRTLPAGKTEISWGGNYPSGRAAPSGVYFFRLEAANESRVRKLILLK